MRVGVYVCVGESGLDGVGVAVGAAEALLAGCGQEGLLLSNH